MCRPLPWTTKSSFAPTPTSARIWRNSGLLAGISNEWVTDGSPAGIVIGSPPSAHWKLVNGTVTAGRSTCRSTRSSTRVRSVTASLDSVL
jgi:hypothetical protein